MKPAKIRIASLAAQKYVYLAKRFNAQAKLLKTGTRYKFYDGVLFKTVADKFSVTTDMVALPVFAIALNITSRDTDDFINGRAAHVRDVDLVKLSRDAFYANGANVDDLSTASDGVPATIPEAFAFGEAMPAGTPSVVYTGFTGKRSEGYTTVRSDRAFDEFTNTTDNQPFVATSDKFWVEVVLAVGGDRFRRFTFSEAWLRQYAPGHDLVSRANRLRLTSNFVAGCSNGRRLALTVPMTDTLPYDPITNNYDTGVVNALTLCIDMLAEDGPEVLWTSFWDRRNENDARIAPYRLYPEDPYDENDYPLPPASGTNRNAVVDTLEMDNEGVVFGVRQIATTIKLPDNRTDPINYDNDLRLRPFGGQRTRYVEWSATGVYSDALISQGCQAGRYFYDKLDSETRLDTSVKNTVLGFLQSYGVQNIVLDSGFSVVALFPTSGNGIGYSGETRFVSITGIIYRRDSLDENGDPVDLTAASLPVSGNSTQYAIVKKEAGAFNFVSYESANTGFETPLARVSSGLSVIVGLDDNGFGTFMSHQNLQAPKTAFVSAGVFATPVTETGTDPDLAMKLAFLSFGGTSTKAIPGITNLNSTVGDESVRVIQEALPDAPSMLALTDDSGAYISNDGGDNWIRAITSERYRDLAYVGNKFLVRPFRKDEPIK